MLYIARNNVLDKMAVSRCVPRYKQYVHDQEIL